MSKHLKEFSSRTSPHILRELQRLESNCKTVLREFTYPLKLSNLRVVVPEPIILFRRFTVYSTFLLFWEPKEAHIIKTIEIDIQKQDTIKT